MRLWDITVTCDHKMLVLAPTMDAALAIARREAQSHGVEIDRTPEEMDLIPGLIAWYPGPLSADAIVDREEEYISRCPACGDPIDYCQGHGEIGDPAGFAILAAHDDGSHGGCHPDGCDEAPEHRLEYLRQEIRAERISYAELAELAELVPYIASTDVELLQWAGVPEEVNHD